MNEREELIAALHRIVDIIGFTPDLKRYATLAEGEMDGALAQIEDIARMALLDAGSPHDTWGKPE